MTTGLPKGLPRGNNRVINRGENRGNNKGNNRDKTAAAPGGKEDDFAILRPHLRGNERDGVRLSEEGGRSVSRDK